MKEGIRIIGLDDGPFTFQSKTTPVVGVIIRVPTYIEGIIRFEVTVDGTDATEKVISNLKNSRFIEQLRLILVDGIAFGGFNNLDIVKIYNELSIPVLTLTRDKPDFDKIEKALKKKFKDWEQRWTVITKQPVKSIKIKNYTIYGAGVGIDEKEILKILEKTTIRGAIPEPLRIAHLVATAMSKI